jgi:hypothetical protein
MPIDVAIWRDKCDYVRSQESLKYKRPDNRNTAQVEYKTKSGTCNDGSKWDHAQTIQKIPEPRTGKARNQWTTENSLIWHWALIKPLIR